MDPSIRTHDVVFEQWLAFGFVAVGVIVIAVGIIVHLTNKDRRY